MLREFAESGYPVVISTKSMMVWRRQYLDLISRGSVVLQISMVSPLHDAEEPGVGSFRERFRMLECLSRNSLRLLIRVQPYDPEDLDFLIGFLPAYASSGVHGIMVEGRKVARVGGRFSERHGSSGVYAYDELAVDFEILSEACHGVGLRFYSAENRLRGFGDSGTCCGTDGLEGFVGNYANCNHPEAGYSAGQLLAGTGRCFSRSWYTIERHKRVCLSSYAELMDMERGV